MGNVRVAHYLASFHKNVIFVKTRHCFIYPPSVAEMSFLGIPKKLLQMMLNLKSAQAVFKLSPRISLSRLQILEMEKSFVGGGCEELEDFLNRDYNMKNL